MNHIPDFYPIPKDFWCFETGERFRHCFMCKLDLMATGTNYLIEKGFRQQETLFEYAMCVECVQKMREQLSVQSRKLINHYFEEHVDIEARRKHMIKRYGRRTRSWIDRCMIKDKPKSACEEYTIYGWFIDSDIVFTGMPYMLSGEVLDELFSLLSNETIDVLDDFSEKLFGIDLSGNLLLL